MEIENRIAELFAAALDAPDEDARWEIVRALHRRPARAVFDAAATLVRSGAPLLTALGADVLGQLGTTIETGVSPFAGDSLPLLLAASNELEAAIEEDAVAALESVLYALGRMNDARATARLLEFAGHADAGLRLAVAFGLLAIDEDAAVAALVALSGDSDEDVRNWATFGLGSQLERDAPEIRAALVRRLAEPEGEVTDEIRGEALVGLAVRGDARVVEPLIEELERAWVGPLAVEAAGAIGDARLRAPLAKLRGRWDGDAELIAAAIAACGG